MTTNFKLQTAPAQRILSFVLGDSSIFFDPASRRFISQISLCLADRCLKAFRFPWAFCNALQAITHGVEPIWSSRLSQASLILLSSLRCCASEEIDVLQKNTTTNINIQVERTSAIVVDEDFM